MTEQTIIHGDCLEVMKTFPDKSFDLVLTDPPYGINVGGKSRGRERVKVGGAKPFGTGRNTRSISPKSYVGFDDSRIPSKEYFTEMRRISKNQIIFGGNYFTEHLEPSSCWIVWDKDNGKSFFADCELAWTSFDTAVRKFKWKWNGMLQEQMGRNKEMRIHPTQKPLELFRWLIDSYTEEGATILDPFGGSGTTAVAAKQLKRNCTLIEISETYAEVARTRLSQDMLF